jgi:hypothetical protein
MRMLPFFLLIGCDDSGISAVPAGAVSERCAGRADAIDGTRLAADVAHLATSSRASDPRRAETRAWLHTELAAAGLPATDAPFTLAGQSGVNVLAGTGPVLVAAHYDSVAAAPGADDNATGVAVVLAVARALGGEHARYAFFDVEEPRPATVGSDTRNFAFGSQAYADTAPDVHVALVVESVGFSCDGCQTAPAGVPASVAPRDGRGVYLVGNQHGAERWSSVQAAFAAVSPPPYAAHALVVPGTGLGLPASRFSDNAPLWDAGIDAIMVTDTALLRNPHYHRESDTPETLDPAYLTAVARGVLVAASALGGGCGDG